MNMFVFMNVKHFFFFIQLSKNKNQKIFFFFVLLAHWTYWLESSCTINCWPHIDNIGSTMPCLHFVWKLYERTTNTNNNNNKYQKYFLMFFFFWFFWYNKKGTFHHQVLRISHHHYHEEYRYSKKTEVSIKRKSKNIFFSIDCLLWS